MKLRSVHSALQSTAGRIADATPWLAWLCPIVPIVQLPVANPITRLLLWIVGDALAGILACAETANESEIPYCVYLLAACGLIGGLVIAARRF